MTLSRGKTLAASLLLALCAATGAAAQDDSAARARRVLADAGCQPGLPGDGAAGGASGNRRSDGQAGQRRGGRGTPLPSSALSGAGNLATVLLWLVVAGAVVFIVVAIVQNRGAAVSPAAPRAVRGRGEEAPPDAPVELPDHARAAAAGDYGAALHALLRAAFETWSTRAGALPVHTTARELLRRARAVVPAEALAQLVAADERVRFGGHSASREQYDGAVPQLAAWEAACRATQ